MPATTPLATQIADRVVEVAGRPVLGLHPGPGRVRVGLVVPAVGREADLTVAPSAAVACLDDAARRQGVEPEEARAQLRLQLASACRDAGAWRPRQPVDPVAEVGGAAFPVLGAAYDRGAAPVGAVPRWAVSVLAAPDGRAAARAAFGPRATRPVVRALAAALAGDGPGAPVGLAALGLALAGSEVLEPDRLARVLAAATGVETGPPLSVDELAGARVLVAALGPRRGEQVLCDAARAEGRRRLGEVVRLWPDVAHRIPPPPPGRLAELTDRCRSLVVTDPGPLPRPARAAPRRGGEERGRGRGRGRDAGTGAGARAQEALPRRPAVPAEALGPEPPLGHLPGPPIGADRGGLRAPAPQPARAFGRPRDADRRVLPTGLVGPTPDPSTPVPASDRLARLDGWEGDGIRLVRARTCGDLARWGRALSSCVGSFGAAAVAGRSELLAIYDGTEVRGCLELTPEGTLRQLLGPANRPVRPAVRAAVLRALVDPGGLDPTRPGNRGWYAADLPPGTLADGLIGPGLLTPRPGRGRDADGPARS